MGKKIAVVSALGGQGHTLSAAYAGSAAADIGKSVTLLDLCGFGGTLAHVLGVAENVSMNVGDVLRGACSYEDALVECSPLGLSIMPSSGFSGEYINPYSIECRRIVEGLGRERNVIADIPSGVVPDCGAVQCFDMIIICAAADRLSLKYAAALVRMIKNSIAQCNAKCEARLMITKFSSEYMRAGGVSDIDECIDIVGARLLGVMPYDKAVEQAAIAGRNPDMRCDAMQYCRDAAHRIFGEKIPLESKKSLF